MRTRARIGFFYSLVIAFFVVVFVLSAEAFLRARGSFQTWKEQNGKTYVSPYQGMHTWYFTLKPNSRGTYRQAEFDFERHANSAGFRDRAWAEQKPDGVTRILALGDSFTEGQGAELENSYPKILEQELRKAGHSVEVLNAGLAGSDPFFQYVLLRDKLIRFSPDLVLVMMNTTDLDDVIIRGGMGRFQADGTVAPPRQSNVEPLYKRSHFFRFIHHRMLGRNSFFLTRDETRSLRKASRRELADVAGLFRDLGIEKDFRLLVVLQPIPRKLENATPTMPTVARRLGESDIPFLDVGPSMRGRIALDPSIDQFHWKIDGHYNASGYAVLAQSILEELYDKKLLEIAADNR